MARVYISIGSNIDTEKNIRIAVRALQQHYGELTLSSVYESEAVGFEGDNFLNLVARLNTEQDVYAVATIMRDIEDANGRIRSGSRFSSRTLDLDLLLYDNAVIHDAQLDIPRNEINKNAFVLLPLVEIDPQLIHPESGKTIAELWHIFNKESQKLWPIAFNFTP